MKITFDELYGAAAAQQASRYDSVVRGFEEMCIRDSFSHGLSAAGKR